MTFPDGFWWGTAASSTQAEGAAPASDWYAAERVGRVPPSGTGNGFATQYAGDFAAFAAHGLTHHRLSLEWARLEPEPGRHDPEAIDHYRALLQAARDAGISAWACLHHFTLPGWFSVDEHGFRDERGRTYFWPRHVDFVAETFGDLLFGWQPVNEPFAYAATGWALGTHPPFRRDLRVMTEVLEGTHLAAFDAARRLRGTGLPVATIHNLSPLRAAADTAEAHSVMRDIDQCMWGCWTSAIRDGSLEVPGRAPVERAWFRDAFDLIGFSYYSADLVHADGSFSPYPPDARVGPLGYAPWSHGLAEVIHRLAEMLPDHPLLVAEHGVGTDDDAWRSSILRESIGLVEEAIADGIDVRGFFHWTGVDNYEWNAGFTVPFGLFDRDRTPRLSAAVAAELARG